MCRTRGPRVLRGAAAAIQYAARPEIAYIHVQAVQCQNLSLALLPVLYSTIALCAQNTRAVIILYLFPPFPLSGLPVRRVIAIYVHAVPCRHMIILFCTIVVYNDRNAIITITTFAGRITTTTGRLRYAGTRARRGRLLAKHLFRYK